MGGVASFTLATCIITLETRTQLGAWTTPGNVCTWEANGFGVKEEELGLRGWLPWLPTDSAFLDLLYFISSSLLLLWAFVLAYPCAWNSLLTGVYMAYWIFNTSANVMFWWGLHLQLSTHLLTPGLLKSLPSLFNLSHSPYHPCAINHHLYHLLLSLSLKWVLYTLPLSHPPPPPHCYSPNVKSITYRISQHCYEMLQCLEHFEYWHNVTHKKLHTLEFTHCIKLLGTISSDSADMELSGINGAWRNI